MKFENTVAALSTPYGRGAIAMIRMTGEDAIKITSAVFRAKNGKDLSEIPSSYAVYGEFVYQGDVIDDGIVTVYRAPKSYTGEDMAELCCHGGMLVSSLILRSLVDAGAAYAEGGEFTKRAFINGKLRLTSAEAIMDIIDAESVGALKLAGGANRGLLSETAESIYNELKHLIASAYAYIDYPDEDMTDVSVNELKDRIKALIGRAKELKDSYKTGSAVCEGVRTVICGRPNVGKSSVMNMLTGEQTAIVTEIPGTTRDVVTGSILCGQVRLKLSDTAGIRDTTDAVEEIGVAKAKETLNKAQLVLAVFDGARQPDEEEQKLIDGLKKLNIPVIAVINKNDLGGGEAYDNIFTHTVHISAKNGKGKEQIERLTEELFTGGEIDYGKPHLINGRQYAQTVRFIDSCKAALDALESGQTQDVACFDLEEALSAIAGLDGLEVKDDIINEIFSKFCVGK
ncbi:MAG: tRNA uridine-5-carboxymethylaminomethyl(34) synthesis GTPase MnmE [Clostridia bacterium]|nr:tRNA uridine-5-carboxymethylaminomethyl(34) synthesis GTPase MnmE [Clostridia bacterium]